MINISQLNAKASFLAITTILSVISVNANAGGQLIGLGTGIGAFDYDTVEINANGTVVIGEVEVQRDPYLLFEDGLWTESSGTLRFGAFFGVNGGIGGVNADGSVIVGSSVGHNGREAFRWTQVGGLVSLGKLSSGDLSSGARSVSADGSVIVGYSSSSNGQEAFRWTEAEGMIGIGDLSGGSGSEARLVSANGEVIIGRSYGINAENFRWTQAEGMVGLSSLFGADYINSTVRGLSTDGSVMVGRYSSISGTEAYRWTQTDGVVGLGYLSGYDFSSYGRGVSADGSVIVGTSTSNIYDDKAFLWTETEGMVSLMDWLTSKNVDMSGFTHLVSAEGISADGKTILGYGFNSAGKREAFIVTVTAVPEPESLAMLMAGLGLIGLVQRRSKLVI